MIDIMKPPNCAVCRRPVEKFETWIDRCSAHLYLRAECHGEAESVRVSDKEMHAYRDGVSLVDAFAGSALLSGRPEPPDDPRRPPRVALSSGDRMTTDLFVDIERRAYALAELESMIHFWFGGLAYISTEANGDQRRGIVGLGMMIDALEWSAEIALACKRPEAA